MVDLLLERAKIKKMVLRTKCPSCESKGKIVYLWFIILKGGKKIIKMKKVLFKDKLWGIMHITE